MEATVSALLNQQINKEFYSAYLYLDIANFYASKGDVYKRQAIMKWISACLRSILSTH